MYRSMHECVCVRMYTIGLAAASCTSFTNYLLVTELNTHLKSMFGQASAGEELLE